MRPKIHPDHAPAVAIADSLIEAAVTQGSPDDTTVIVVRPDT